MSLPALPAFTEDCMGRSDELAAILVTRRAGPRRGASDCSSSGVREERRTANVAAAATLATHTGGHIAYAARAGSGEPVAVRRATLLASRRGDDSDVLAAPRAWKNDFR